MMEAAVGRNQCGTCGKSFADAGKLSRHVKEQHSGPVVKHQCPSCDKSYKRPESLRNHIRGAHEKSSGMWCEECQKNFLTLQSYQIHMEHVHENRHKFQCGVCEKKFKYESTMLIHQSRHTMNRFPCQICSKCFVTKKNLDKHMSHVHDDNDSNPKAVEEVQCFHCGLWAISREVLESHVRTHHEARKFQCNVCGKQFSWERNLTAHLKVVHKEKVEPSTAHVSRDPTQRYECKLCGKTDMTRSYMIRHVGANHLQDKDRAVLNCKLCSNKFFNKASIFSHIKSKHPGGLTQEWKNEIREQHKEEQRRWHKLIWEEGDYIIDRLETKDLQEVKVKCNECHMVFMTKQALDTHVLRVHKKAFRMECPECKKVLADKRNWTLHIKKYHDDIDLSKVQVKKLEPYTDEEAKEASKHPNHPFECRLCGKTFQTRSTGYRHFSTHHLEDKKILACQFCDSYSAWMCPALIIHTKKCHPEIYTDELEREIKLRGRKEFSRRVRVIQQGNFIVQRPSSDYHNEDESCMSDGDSFDEDSDMTGSDFGDDWMDDSASDINVKVKFEEGDQGTSFQSFEALKPEAPEEEVKPVLLPIRLKAMKVELPICWTCGKQFNRIKCCSRRILSSVENTNQCLACDGCFGPFGLLETHVEEVRLLRDNICHHCCKIFQTKGELKRHVFAIHESNSDNDSDHDPDLKDPPPTTLIWNKVAIGFLN